MPRWCQAAIAAWATVAGIAQAGYVFRPLHKSGLLIGAQLVPQTIHDLLAAYAAQLGFDNLAPHDLRRTFAKLARKGGAGLEQLQAALGHASISTTERYLGAMQDFTIVPGEHIGIQVRCKAKSVP